MGMRLKPFHLGKHQGHRFMINIEEMKAHPIDEETFSFLRQLTENVDDISRSQNNEQLQALGLLAQKPKKAARDTPIDPVPIVNAAFFLTQSCNLRCVYCYGEGGNMVVKGIWKNRPLFRQWTGSLNSPGRPRRSMWDFLVENRF